jgi:uncharacterized protein (DUF697 family)
VASTVQAYREMEEFLAPRDLPREDRLNILDRIHRADEPNPAHEVDLVLYEYGLPLPSDAYVFDPAGPGAVTDAILAGQYELALPLARQFPAFRRPVVERFVMEVARENALFTLATALPNVLPSLLELPWALTEFASDTVFLSANQVRLSFLIGAACGKDIGFGSQKTEMAAIVAGAFGWRALARELAGKIPLGGGLLPKAAIAFAGTFAMGKGLEYFHHANRQFSPSEREAAFQEGLERGHHAVEGMRTTKP